MPGPANAGGFIYAKDLQRISMFYQQLLSMKLLFGDADHHVLESADFQLLIHAIAAQFASAITISSPPALRDNTAIKLFFTVQSLSVAQGTAERLGGGMFEQAWAGPGFTARNVFDPEGNISQLREK
jgi:predicted enzyme related to lactoylglutathione lyase